VSSGFRQRLETFWRMFSKGSILIDDTVTDGALLHAFLTQYDQKPLNKGPNDELKYGLYNARDLVRGQFSMIDPDYQSLQKTDLQGAIARTWDAHFKPEQSIWTSDQPNMDIAVFGPMIKHNALFDSRQLLLTFFKMKDIANCFRSEIV
jgi:hypothetical protein